MSAPPVTSKTVVCAACEKTHTIRFNPRTGAALNDHGWKSHVSWNHDGRIEKSVLVYTCTSVCETRITQLPLTKIMQEARDWLALADNS